MHGQQNATPLCPKCGSPARVVLVRLARVRCDILPDGSIGRVLSCSRDKRSIVAYECGGGHEWTTDETFS